LARVWPFLTRSNQLIILGEIFSQPLVPSSPASGPPKVQTSPGKPHVTVRATVLPPGSPLPPAIIQRLPLTSDPSRHLNGLTLLRDLTASEFKLPFVAILAAKNDALTTLALQIAWERNELLPAAELLKLLSSSSNEVRRLAV